MLETNYLSEVGCGKFTADSLSVVKYVGRESKNLSSQAKIYVKWSVNWI